MGTLLLPAVSSFAQVTFTGNAGAGSINPDGSSTITNTGDRATGTANPLTWQGASSGAAPSTDETTASIDGINHDRFVLTVNPGDYSNKIIFVTIDWTSPATDYDLHVHKGAEDGPEVYTSAGGAPSTREKVSIDPGITGTGDYYINVVYFTAPDASASPYTGRAVVQTGPVARSATYIHGGITFSPNTPVKASTSSSDGEPSSRVDVFGNYYVCGIRGVPAGVDLWYFDLRPTLPFAPPARPAAKAGRARKAEPAGSVGPANPNYDPNMRVPIYRGQPDAVFTNQSGLAAGGLGGGDIDLAVGFGNYPANPDPVLAYASLTAANLTVGNSLDRAATFTFNPVGNFAGGVPVNDRQWMGFYNNSIVYLEYRNFAQGIAFVQQSTDGGRTYGNAVSVGMVPQTGALDVDRSLGNVYISSNDGQVAVGDPSLNPALNTPADAPLTYTIHRAVPASIDSANIFFPIRVADDHTVYGTYSDGRNIFLLSSVDHGTTWSAPVQVNDPADPNTKLNLLPWLATGPTAGSVGIAWYGTDNAANDDNAKFRVYFAQTFNATGATPAFRVVQASDHSIHAANISLKGLPLTGVSPNRNLLDYFQINFDPTGAAILGYTDDHNDFNGHTYVTRQISGPAINGGGTSNVPPPVEGSALPQQPFATPGTPPPTPTGIIPQPMQPGPFGEQVTDFAEDQDSGLLAATPTVNPVDIISVKYTSQDNNSGPVLTATMKVSDLTTIPPSTTWRMFFAANAPETGIVQINGNSYSKGLSDRGDQFFVQAVTSANGSTATFSWGTTVRNFDGSTTNTVQGTADRGFFNKTAKTIAVRISSSVLNSYLAGLPGSHPPIATGSVLCGLRATASSATGVALEDATRGGTEFVVGSF